MQIPTNPGNLGVTLQQFAYFLSAVEHGSLSAAAEANFMAQPSLSEQIRRMERTLGVTLFVRTNRALILTDAARTLVPHAEKALAAAYSAIDAMTPIRELTGGSVTFGTFSTARHLFHTDLIIRFRASFPGVGIRLIGDNSVKIADEVREGRIEAAVVALPVDDRGLDTEPLAWSPQICYLSRDPEVTSSPVSIQDIAEAELVMPEVEWGDSDPTRRRLMEAAQRAGLRVVSSIEVSPYTALELAAEGLADTIAPYSLAQATGFLNRLHWAPLDPPMRENFAFIKRRNATLSPGARAVRSIIEKLVDSIPVDAEG
ncbi:LysR family transcriptional regulator [Corynebacterium halotolerans]|uniref:LysR family transcriptional regulator n=1 Tax=Corynebacterium halotolerans TaxID=225326 RepID=UPI003CF4232C